MRVRLVLAGLAAMAAACTMNPPQNDFPPPDYSGEPVRLDVAEIAVEQSFKAPMAPEHVEHQVPLNPADTVRTWVDQRLAAEGVEGTATVDIETASLVHEKLDTESGITGFFTTETAARYVAELALSVDIEMVGQTTTTRITARRTKGLPEGASVHERDEAAYELVKALVRDTGGELAQTLRQRNVTVASGGGA